MWLVIKRQKGLCMPSTEMFISATCVWTVQGQKAKADLVVRVQVKLHEVFRAGGASETNYQRAWGWHRAGLGHGSQLGNRVGVTERLRDREGTRDNQGNRTGVPWHLL